MDQARIEHFFTTLGTVTSGAREVGSRLALELGSDLNLLDLMRTDELGLSRLLAMLIDPNGAHGQGSVFLALFLDACGFDRMASDASEAVRVECEVSLGGEAGRIDILINLPGGRVIGIENKPYALEGDAQLARYAKSLDESYGPGAHLVFVPGWSDRAWTITSEEIKRFESDGRRYRVLPWNGGDVHGVTAWLRRCEEKARAPKVRHLLADFADWAEDRFTMLDEKGTDV